MDTKPVLPEEELVPRLLARDRQAFTDLYDQYGNAMLGILVRLVNNPDEAENLLQDSFIKVWRYIDRFDASKGRLFTWLATICRNTALNYIRSSENRSKLPIQTGSECVYTEGLVTEPTQLDHIGIKKQVVNLEEKHRSVINLIYYWGYTQQEVAEKLNLPLGTVKSRTRTALQLLKEQLS